MSGKLVRRLAGARRRIVPARIAEIRTYQRLLRGKVGIEIGGPSRLFGRRGAVPLYGVVSRLDNCVFSQRTVWAGEVVAGSPYRVGWLGRLGTQMVCEGSHLEGVPTAAYDFVLASHVIEHIANPLAALSEWVRVLADSGTLVVAVPDKEHTFDHDRPVTSFGHLVEDFTNGIDERDLTHLPEILEYHDLRMDPDAGSFEAFKERARENFANRCLHHHVFDGDLVTTMVQYVGLRVEIITKMAPFHIIAIARKAH